MTEALLLERIEELKKLRDNALANANALGGAIQDCEFWLNRLRGGGTTDTTESGVVPDSTP